MNPLVLNNFPRLVRSTPPFPGNQIGERMTQHSNCHVPWSTHKWALCKWPNGKRRFADGEILGLLPGLWNLSWDLGSISFADSSNDVTAPRLPDGGSEPWEHYFVCVMMFWGQWIYLLSHSAELCPDWAVSKLKETEVGTSSQPAKCTFYKCISKLLENSSNGFINLAITQCRIYYNVLSS